jgi:hypothetical protein
MTIPDWPALRYGPAERATIILSVGVDETGHVRSKQTENRSIRSDIALQVGILIKMRSLLCISLKWSAE